MNKVLIDEAQEMLRIHRVLLHEAQMINESFPRLCDDINREILSLHHKKRELTTRFDRSEEDVARYSGKIKEDETKIELLRAAPISYSSRHHGTGVQKLARLKRQVAALELQMLKVSKGKFKLVD